ncbi:transcription initiation factor TFIID subunit 12 [Exaiptasia diaphana]|uniref:Uncharacterized protein n=1 Tax=Exaiptasia diaphana TaxID=2652724 RepID=A0A913X415_EXADI|nr:transcription initiation factor TFIID subunit 12 [Exaiptasia diaphana]
MIQEVSQRIQNFGPGPITTEQALELDKLKLIYSKLLKSQGEVIITPQQPGHAQVAMTTQGTLSQGVTPQQSISAVPRIVPAVTTNQVPGNTPITTTVTILTQGSGIPTKIAVTNPTTLTTAQIQQIQAQALSQVQAHAQTVTRASVPINQQQQVKVASAVAGQNILATGQRILTSTPGSVTIATPTPVTALKSTQNTIQSGIKQVSQSPSPSVGPLQRQLAPNKIQSGIMITAAQPTGSIQNIAPSTTTASKNLVSHSGITNRVETSSPQPQQVLTKRRIQELLHEIDPQEQMDDDVEDVRNNILNNSFSRGGEGRTDG